MIDGPCYCLNGWVTYTRGDSVRAEPCYSCEKGQTNARELRRNPRATR